MKKKIKLNKRDVVVLIVIVCIVIFIYAKYIIYKGIKDYQFATEMEAISSNNENAVFCIDKIVLYSSASAIDNSEGATMQDLDICQYTDIAIYIDNTSYITELTEENTIKELYIDNIEIEEATSKGEKSLSYKNPLNYGKFQIVSQSTSEEEQDTQEEQDTEEEQNTEEEQEVQENQDSDSEQSIEEEENTEEEQDTEEQQNTQQGKIYYNIIYTNENNEKSDYSTPTYYTDCSNPITLTYTNNNIVTGYAVSVQDTQITFDGSILQSVGINLEDIQNKVSFDINIKNNLDEEFECSVVIDIPLNSETKSIYNDYVYVMENNLQSIYTFFKK